MSSKINFLLPGVLMVLLGAIIWSFGIHLLGSGLVLGGIVSLIVQSINLSKPESERILDERIERINEKAGFHAFWILIFSAAIITALSWYFELKLRDALEFLFLAGIFSFILLRFYFSRRSLE